MSISPSANSHLPCERCVIQPIHRFFCTASEMKDTETFLLAYFMTDAGTFMTFYVIL